MKVVQPCGCSYEKTATYVDQLVCARHTEEQIARARALAKASERCAACGLITGGRPHDCDQRS